MALAVGCNADNDADGDTLEPSTEGRRQRAAPADGDDGSPSTSNQGGSAASGGSAAEASQNEGQLGGSAGAPEPPVGSGGGNSSGSEALPPEQVIDACIAAGGPYSACDTIYVTIQQPSATRCVQLNIDNCVGYNRRLTVDLPAQWQLAAGSVGADLDECELGVFYSASTPLVDASGTISWNETAPEPTGLVLDLTLEPSGAADDAAPIEVATTEPFELGRCPDELSAP